MDRGRKELGILRAEDGVRFLAMASNVEAQVNTNMVIRVQALLGNKQGMGSSSLLNESEQEELFLSMVNEKSKTLDANSPASELNLVDKQRPTEEWYRESKRSDTDTVTDTGRWIIDKGPVDCEKLLRRISAMTEEEWSTECGLRLSYV